jgi:hypothetical protein
MTIDTNDEIKRKEAWNMAKEIIKEGIPGLCEKSDLTSIGDSVFKSTGVKFTINSLYEIRREAVTEHDEDFNKKIARLEKDSNEKIDKIRGDKETLNEALREREDEIVGHKKTVEVLTNQNAKILNSMAEIYREHEKFANKIISDYDKDNAEYMRSLSDLRKSIADEKLKHENETKDIKKELESKSGEAERYKKETAELEKTAKRNGNLAFYSLTGVVWFVSYAVIYLVFGLPTLRNVDPVGLIWLMPVLVIGGAFYVLVKYYFSNNPMGIVLVLIIIGTTFYANMLLSDVPLNHSTQRLIFWIAPAYLLGIYLEASTILRYQFFVSVALWYHALVRRFHNSIG